MENAEIFLESMQDINPDITDYEEAISFALEQTPKVDYDRWFGDIDGKGTYYADSRESRWFPNMTPEMVANILAGEML
jgi:hypothetical protein